MYLTPYEALAATARTGLHLILNFLNISGPPATHVSAFLLRTTKHVSGQLLVILGRSIFVLFRSLTRRQDGLPRYTS